MNASVKEIKRRLSRFLADPQSEQNFPTWFALRLRDENDPDAESFAFAIQRVFSDSANGAYTPEESTAILSHLANQQDAPRVMVYAANGTSSNVQRLASVFGLSADTERVTVYDS